MRNTVSIVLLAVLLTGCFFRSGTGGTGSGWIIDQGAGGYVDMDVDTKIEDDVVGPFFPVPAPGHAFQEWYPACRNTYGTCGWFLNAEARALDVTAEVNAAFDAGYSGSLRAYSKSSLVVEGSTVVLGLGDISILGLGNFADAPAVAYFLTDSELTQPVAGVEANGVITFDATSLDTGSLEVFVTGVDFNGLLASAAIELRPPVPMVVVKLDFANFSAGVSVSTLRSQFFTGSNSVAAFFSGMTGDVYSLIPVGESSGPSDGVVQVTSSENLPLLFESDQFSTAGIEAEIGAALSQAIDLAQLDRDGSGLLEPDELLVAVVTPLVQEFTSVYGLPGTVSSTSGQGLADGIAIAFAETVYENGDRSSVAEHELSHLLFDLADLYDIDGSSPGVGPVGLMGTIPYEPNARPALLGYSKLDMGLTSVARTISEGKRVTASFGDAALPLKFDDAKYGSRDNYLLIEARRPSTIADQHFESPGLVITQVNASQFDNSDDADRLVDVVTPFGEEDYSFVETGQWVWPGSAGRNSVEVGDMVISGITVESDGISFTMSAHPHPSTDSVRLTSGDAKEVFYLRGDRATIPFGNPQRAELVDGFEVDVLQACTVDWAVYETVTFDEFVGDGFTFINDVEVGTPLLSGTVSLQGGVQQVMFSAPLSMRAYTHLWVDIERRDCGKLLLAHDVSRAWKSGAVYSDDGYVIQDVRFRGEPTVRLLVSGVKREHFKQ